MFISSSMSSITLSSRTIKRRTVSIRVLHRYVLHWLSCVYVHLTDTPQSLILYYIYIYILYDTTNELVDI